MKELVEVNQSQILNDSDGIWQVILLNCHCHTFGSVITQIMLAVDVSQFKATSLANIAHHTSQVKICEGSRDRCEKAAGILSEIGLDVLVESRGPNGKGTP